MLPSAHFFSTIIAYLLLDSQFSLPSHSLFLMIIIGVGTDLDILFKKAHRKTLAHSLFFLFIAVPFLLFDFRYFIIVLLTILLHLTLDSIDWELYPLYPFSEKITGSNILSNKSKLNPEEDSIFDFVKFYFSNYKLLTIETMLAFTAIIGWILAYT